MPMIRKIFQEEIGWGGSLLIKCGLLGLGISIVWWLGWPQPPSASLDEFSSARQQISETATLKEASDSVMTSTLFPKRETLHLHTDEGKVYSFQKSFAPTLVDLNGSSRIELEVLPGIGKVLADRIVSYRTTNGRFTQIQDLVKVSGIGKKRLKRLEPFVTIETAVGEKES